MWRLRIGLSLMIGFAALPVGCLSEQSILPTGQPSVGVGYRDFSFRASDVIAPTGRTPQSVRLWFNDGSWWGSLFNRSTDVHSIHRFNWATNSWIDTGTDIDERNNSRGDYLWDGRYLYVATTVPTSTSGSAYILRYSYDAIDKRYTLDSGFPVIVTSGGVKAIVLAKDSTGMLWVTYTHGKAVYVSHSTADDRTWAEPYVLPVTGAANLTRDDVSALIAFDSQIGVMWSNQTDDAMYFATHADGSSDNQWEVNPALQGPGLADNHISLVSLEADPRGRVFSAVKTSLNELPNPDPEAPLTLLLVLAQDGNWQHHTFGRVLEDHTRPLLLIDEEHRTLYMFATAPVDGGTIYYKKTSLDKISFPAGLGTPFIRSNTDTHINNPASTKQRLNSTTGLLVLAGDEASGYYLHNVLDLGTIGPSRIPAATPEGTAVWVLETCVRPCMRANHRNRGSFFGIPPGIRCELPSVRFHRYLDECVNSISS